MGFDTIWDIVRLDEMRKEAPRTLSEFYKLKSQRQSDDPTSLVYRPELPDRNDLQFWGVLHQVRDAAYLSRHPAPPQDFSLRVEQCNELGDFLQDVGAVSPAVAARIRSDKSKVPWKLAQLPYFSADCINKGTLKLLKLSKDIPTDSLFLAGPQMTQGLRIWGVVIASGRLDAWIAEHVKLDGITMTEIRRFAAILQAIPSDSSDPILCMETF